MADRKKKNDRIGPDSLVQLSHDGDDFLHLHFPVSHFPVSVILVAAAIPAHFCPEIGRTLNQTP